MSLAADIARSLGQGKEQKNRDGWVTCCPVHKDREPSMSIWDDEKDGIKVHCQVGCDFKEIKDSLRGLGLLPEWQPEAGRNGKKHTPPSPEKKDHHPEVEKPSYVWKKSSKAGLENAEKYFSGRKITLPLPVCLKWGEYTDKESGQTTHMIVAAASKPSDESVFAVQRLFIDIEENKKTGAKMHGHCEGRGVWQNRKADHTEVMIGEGIETVMSAIQATGKNGVAALSTSGVKNLILPDQTNTIFLLVDSDPRRDIEAKSMPGQKAAYAKAKEFVESREGREAYLVAPDDTCFSDSPNKLDFNDLLQADPTGESIRQRFTMAIRFQDVEWRPQEGSAEEGQDDSGDSYYPLETLKQLRNVNEQYATVLIGGDFRIVKEGFDSVAKKHTLSFLKTTSLYSHYANVKVRVPSGGGGQEWTYKPIAKVWMEWEDRRSYEDVVFDPSGRARKEAYNLFRGFPLTPKQGDWSRMRDHIEKVICAGNAEHFAYVLAWMARAVQDPGGDKPGVAIVLKGGKGIGKGVFVNYFGDIFGEAFLPIADSDSFTGRFNMHLSKALLAFLDEAVWGGDKKAEGKLKQLITEPNVMFEPKGIDSIALDNFLNIIIASNEDWVVPATGDERRFLVLQPSEDKKQDTKYFGKILDERRKGGPEAMMYDLLRHDYSTVNLRNPPFTDGLIEQVEESLDSVRGFWRTIFDRGYILSDHDTGAPVPTTASQFQAPGIGDYTLCWPYVVFKFEVFGEYLHWCRMHNSRHPKHESMFWVYTWEIWEGGKQLRSQGQDASERYLSTLKLPWLEDARRAFTKAVKVKFEKTSPDGAPSPFRGQF